MNESWDEFDDEWESGADDELELTVQCSHCSAEYSEECDFCPHCGQYPERPKSTFWAAKPAWFRRLAVIVVLLLILSFLLWHIGDFF